MRSYFDTFIIRDAGIAGQIFGYFFGILALGIVCLAAFGIYCLFRYWIEQIGNSLTKPKYRIDHYQLKDAYYPMCRRFTGWEFINWSGKYYYLSDFESAVPQENVGWAEKVIKRYHEQATGATVTHLDVTINEEALKRQKERAKKYSAKIKV